MRPGPRTLIAAVAVLGLAVAACGSDTGPSSSDRSITVFAAASLTAAFTELGDAFMAAHPDTKVTFNFGASSELVTQIGEGAAADVFASADQRTMEQLVVAGHNGSDPVVFARNELQIIVEPGNPKGIASVADLADPDLVVVTCAPEVPCGAYAATLFANAGVDVTPKSLEKNVKAVVTKVTLGEADAGIVYRTDVLAAGASADGVDIPADLNVLADYPIVVTDTAANVDAANAFTAFVTSAAGEEILTRFGFLRPDAP